MTVIDTPEGIAFAQFCARKMALKMEIRGLKRHGRSVYVICKEAYGLKGSRAAVLLQMENYVKAVLDNGRQPADPQ